MATDLPPEIPTANKTLTAKCYCASVHFTITVPSTSLPLPVHLCHCHICRYTHGTFSVFHAPLPKGTSPVFIAPSSLSSSTTSYVHGPLAASERLFCSTCGCHIGDRDLPSPPSPEPSSDNPPEYKEEEPSWRVATSIFDQHGEDIFQIRTHTFTRNLGSGGSLAKWLPKMGDRAIREWNPELDTSEKFPIPPPQAPATELDDDGKERLKAECHCGGVSFTIPRPNNIPGLDGLPAKYVSKKENNKWVACLDVCDDCRLVDGTHVIGWTFVPLAELQPHVGRDLKLGTLTTYRSSETATRAFCEKCGATVFFLADNRAPDEKNAVVDVAVGILRAPEGVAAEEWLTWRTGRVGWMDSGKKFDKVFAESLAKGFGEWGRERYGEDLVFEIP
ncbi:Mss4-like protein [Apodospora peruviana]|uniref:Mss4-like protein n=1 Tax=Apodospora peruviana TaxID=516989 RepID=A0AAE0HSV0_9PEZI|nr:Mss4-like protein [Apodospora peruviana]